jgi:hypothetical protein
VRLRLAIESPAVAKVPVLFGRKSSPESTTPVSLKEGGKGRPTPSRKEQEAANKARLKATATGRAGGAARGGNGRASSAEVRRAMANGDERYLPARDRGPVRRFIRDWIDSHFTLGEIMVPVLVVCLLLGFVGSRTLAVFGEVFVLIVLVVLAINFALMRVALRRELRKRFPDQSLQGTTYYAIMRSLQVRFLRMPKPQVKMGDVLRDHYR